MINHASQANNLPLNNCGAGLVAKIAGSVAPIRQPY